MEAVPDLDLERLVDFVNKYADIPRATAYEQDKPYPPLDDLKIDPTWASASGLIGLVAMANELYAVFAAPDESASLAALNTILHRTWPSPTATGTGAVQWVVQQSCDVPAAASALCLLGVVNRHDHHRLGLCQASRCADVFVDASPAGRRRFCSSTCLSRHKVAAYRARAKQ